MKTSVLRVWLRVATFTLVVASISYASPITVSNFSFETLGAGGVPFACGTGCSFSTDGVIPGWTVGGTAGLLQPGTPANTTLFNSVPDGSTVAYSNGGTISQTVAPLVQLGVIYTLQVDVLVRKDVGDPGTEALLINGNTILATGVLPAPGGFSNFTATYTGLAADVGKSISIELVSNGVQGDWDNVRLASSLPSPVPEPASGVLMGLAAVALAGIVMRRKRA